MNTIRILLLFLTIQDIVKPTRQWKIPCPSVCVCQNKEAVCSNHDNLHYMPPLPQNINSLVYSNNGLIGFTRNVFLNISKLRLSKLVLMRNDNVQRNIDKRAFLMLPYLESLHLKENALLYALNGGLRTLLWGLKDGAIQEIRLTQMNIYSYYTNMFLDLRTTTLKRIVMDNNIIPNFTNVSLPRGLHYLSLQNNEINEISFNEILPKLETIQLNQNRLEHIPSFCMDDFGNSSFLPNLKVLDLSNNRIKLIGKLDIVGPCYSKLKNLRLGGNIIKGIGDDTFSELPSLLSLSINNLDPHVSLGYHSLNSSSLIHLDIGNKFNAFSERLDVLFRYCPNLKSLNMTGVQLTAYQDVAEKIFRVFRSLRKIEILILKRTSLTTFPKKLFPMMPKLTNLSLQDCRLKDSQLNNFVNVTLNFLLLDNNLISTITKANIPEKVKHLGLSGNPFYCTCDLVWFRAWLRQNSGKILGWPSNYSCSLPKEWVDKSLSDFDLDYSFCHPIDPYIVFAICISSAFCLFVIMSFIFYKKRWQIKYQLYRLRAKRRGYQVLGDHGFAYDVFVSYNSADSVWVISEMIPRLEKKEKLKLCLHERDFEVGKHIVDNIVDAIQNSRKVLIILSNRFAQSQWCQFESTMAQLRSIKNGEGAVIVIILENIHVQNMSKPLNILMKTTTLIEWTNDKRAKEMLWESVVSTIKS
ncbi:toll-like receptor 2 [Saccostrea cucullata]|uniref:toll-like receptor 2 n=1 Tax=Saccostrea cuccullata TaxID=36930 RepID=UPI002ED0C499